MKQENELLFTYGTLRKDIDIPMQRFLSNRTTWIGEAEFKGKLFFVGGHPAAVPSSAKEDTITGDLFRIDSNTDLIQRLDQYEGYDKNNRSTSLYIREKRKVRLKETKKTFLAWIYLFNKPVDDSQEIESGNYLHYYRDK